MDNDFQAVAGQKSVAGEKEGEKCKSLTSPGLGSVHKAHQPVVGSKHRVLGPWLRPTRSRTELEMRMVTGGTLTQSCSVRESIH